LKGELEEREGAARCWDKLSEIPMKYKRKSM
jgi:hypothetical protein